MRMDIRFESVKNTVSDSVMLCPTYRYAPLAPLLLLSFFKRYLSRAQ